MKRFFVRAIAAAAVMFGLGVLFGVPVPQLSDQDNVPLEVNPPAPGGGMPEFPAPVQLPQPMPMPFTSPVAAPELPELSPMPAVQMDLPAEPTSAPQPPVEVDLAPTPAPEPMVAPSELGVVTVVAAPDVMPDATPAEFEAEDAVVTMVEPADVAVGVPPVPPAEVAVGLPPVPQPEVAVGLPPVP